MTHAAITGWGKCLPPAVLTNADLGHLPRDRRRVDRQPHRDEGAARLPRPARRAGRGGRGAGAGLRRPRRGGARPDHRRQHHRRRAGAQRGLGPPAPARRGERRRHGPEHRLHQLPLRPLHRHRPDPHRRGAGRRWWSAARCRPPSWTGRTATPRCSSATAAARWCCRRPTARRGCSPRGSAATPTPAARSTSAAWAPATPTAASPTATPAGSSTGQEIFKRAVIGMAQAGQEALAKRGLAIGDVDLVIPHQANLRIIDAVGRRLGVDPAKVFVNVHRYANMSAATVPVALVEALEEGRVRPGATLLLPAFGAGLTWCAHLVRWGERTTPLGRQRRRAAALRPHRPGAGERAAGPPRRLRRQRPGQARGGARPVRALTAAGGAVQGPGQSPSGPDAPADRGVEDLDGLGRLDGGAPLAEQPLDVERAAGVGAGQVAGAGGQHRGGLARADLVGARRLDQVVDAGAAAALVAVGDLDQLQPGDGAEQRPGRRVDAAGRAPGGRASGRRPGPGWGGAPRAAAARPGTRSRRAPSARRRRRGRARPGLPRRAARSPSGGSRSRPR